MYYGDKKEDMREEKDCNREWLPLCHYEGQKQDWLQILFTSLPLFSHPSNTMMCWSAACHISTFRKVCQMLKELYQKFDANHAAFGDLQPEFPHPHSYRILNEEKEVHFRYTHILEHNKLCFIVVTNTGKQICIKFTWTYSVEVHHKCAQWKVSPKLRGYEDIIGGWQIITMDFLKGYQCLHDIKYSLSDGKKERLREELWSKVMHFTRTTLCMAMCKMPMWWSGRSHSHRSWLTLTGWARLLK